MATGLSIDWSNFFSTDQSNSVSVTTGLSIDNSKNILLATYFFVRVCWIFAVIRCVSWPSFVFRSLVGLPRACSIWGSYVVCPRYLRPRVFVWFFMFWDLLVFMFSMMPIIGMFCWVSRLASFLVVSNASCDGVVMMRNLILLMSLMRSRVASLIPGGMSSIR